MRRRWFEHAIQVMLPWFDIDREAARNARTEAIRQTSIRERKHAETIIEDYQRAEDRAKRRG